MKYPAILVLLTVISFPAMAQLNNRPFEWSRPYTMGDSARVSAGFRTLGFVRNNEYFNDVLEGYTLFGYQVNPYIAWQPGDHVRIEAGVYLSQNFGDDDYQDILPTFTLSYRNRHHQLNFGTLQGALSHRLIEPLYDFENVLSSRRIENGIQYRVINDRLFLDTWLDWRNPIQPGDDDQEELLAGVSAEYNWLPFEKSGFSTIFQATAYHRGGQVNNSALPIQTYLNTAFGLKGWVRKEGFVQELSADIYYVSFIDNSNTSEIPFDEANGVYINMFLKSRTGLGLMLSYWNAEDFYSPEGGRLYQNYSYRPERFGQEQDARELLFFRFLYDKVLADDLNFGARAEPYLDLGSGEVEWSLGLYLNYDLEFRIAGKK
jgi:hypothetical protein